MAERAIIFEPEDVYALLVHYNDGKELPLDANVLSFNVSKMLGRMIGLDVSSDNWPTDGVEISDSLMPIIHIRYEGGRTMSWDEKGVDPTWQIAPEAPKRQ